MAEKHNTTPKSIRRRQCLKEMTDIIELIGPWNINKLALAKKYDFKWDTIARWYNNLILSIKPEEVKNIKIMAENTLTKNIEHCERVRANTNLEEKDRLQGVKILNDTIEKLTKFLQEIGRIEKTAEKIEHTGEATIKIIGPEWWYKKDGDKTGSVHSAPKTTSVPPK